MKITHISQLLPFVEEKPEFKVIDKGDYTVIDYVYQDKDTFDIPELMECRGIKFDKDGLILARPFRKFFNYGERGSDLPIHRPHVITTKLDGSMIHSIMVNNRLFLHTRKGHTDVAKKAERHMMSAVESYYSTFMFYAMQQGWTPIFEYTGPNNRIVLRYDEERLTLVAMRNTVEGDIMPHRDMVRWAESRNIPVVKNQGRIDHVGDFVSATRNLKDFEGYVVYFDDGYIVKIKAEDYVMKHRALDDMSSKKKVIALCAQGFMDDVVPILSEADAQELIDFNTTLQWEVNHLARFVSIAIDMAKLDEVDRKTFALINVPLAIECMGDWIKSCMFAAMDGQDPRMLVLKAIQRDNNIINVKWRGQ